MTKFTFDQNFKLWIRFRFDKIPYYELYSYLNFLLPLDTLQCNGSWACLNVKTLFPGMMIPMLKTRRSLNHLIFNMGIPILVRQHFYIETVPWSTLIQIMACYLICTLPYLNQTNLPSLITPEASLFGASIDMESCLFMKLHWQLP